MIEIVTAAAALVVAIIKAATKDDQFLGYTAKAAGFSAAYFFI